MLLREGLNVSFWMFIWVVLSLVLVGFTVWTLVILLRQKSSWRAFAKKYKLRYRNSSFMASPQVSGIYRAYPVSVFTSEHETERGGTMRKLTAIEVELNSRMPIEGAIASGGMVQLVQNLGFSDEYKPDYDFWNTEYILRSEDRRVAVEYFTAERLEALVKLMNTKNYWVIFIFRGNDTLLRIDTPEPFENLEKLETTVNGLVELAGLLELKTGESGTLASVKQRREVVNAAQVRLDENADFIGLELEEDEVHIAPDIVSDAKVIEEEALEPAQVAGIVAAAPVSEKKPAVKKTAAKKPAAKAPETATPAKRSPTATRKKKPAPKE